MTRQEQLFSEQEYLQSAIVKAGSLPHSEVSGLGILTIRREPLTSYQGGIKCGNRGTGFLDSEGSHR